MELKFLEELGDRADLEVITDEAYLGSYLSSPHDIEALLISESWFDERVALQNVATLLVLTEDRDTERTSNLAADYTFKYTSLNLIFNKVVSSCPRLRDDEASGEAKVLLFYSPVGGAGTTTAAMAVAVVSARRVPARALPGRRVRPDLCLAAARGAHGPDGDGARDAAPDARRLRERARLHRLGLL